MDEIFTPLERGVRVFILGGLNAFGMNCLLLETPGSAWLLDCGIAFPRQDQPGIDYRIPDFAVLHALGDKFQGVIATHGHEDHIGSIPFLIRELGGDLRIVGSEMTRRMVESKLTERRLNDGVEYVVVGDEDVFDDGFATFEFFHVNHSIPGALCVRMATDEQQFLFTGDWKLDAQSPHETPTNLAGIASERPYDIIFADSTNAGSRRHAVSESTVSETLYQAISEAPGRVIISQFASHARRAVQVMEAAQKSGRKVGVVGRSLKRSIEHATEGGYLTIPDDVMMLEGAWNSMPDDEVVLLVTGTQAEPRASLTRASRNDHPLFSIEEGDTVILSARIIPGNEQAVYDVLNDIVTLGATVITDADRPVHTSGHAYPEEMTTLISLTDPKWLAPIHGDFLSRTAHAALAERCGVDVLYLEDGDVLLVEDEPEISRSEALEKIVVEGDRIGVCDEETLRQRRQIGYVGVVTVHVKTDGDSISSIKMQTMGVDIVSHDRKASIDDCVAFIYEEFDREQPEDINEFLRIAIRRYYRKRLDRKPVVISFVD